jgi:hypothetical protein
MRDLFQAYEIVLSKDMFKGQLYKKEVEPQMICNIDQRHYNT